MNYLQVLSKEELVSPQAGSLFNTFVCEMPIVLPKVSSLHFLLAVYFHNEVMY